MILATIKKLDGTHLDHGNFESEAAALAFFQPRIDKGIYGQKHVPAVTIPAELDEQGNEISPEQIIPEIPAAFTIEFVDLSLVPKTQDEINAEALKFLADTDFQVLRHIGQQSLGLATSLTAEAYQQLERDRQMAREAIIR